jgi:calcium/calmodulin-dependent protein kinase I
MWSLGVITYTLLCGYSPFRSESLADLIEETKNGRVIFHERYWKDVSQEAKDFIMTLLKPNPSERATSHKALQDPWIAGRGATDHNLLPEIRAMMAKARLKRGVELVKLANRIEALRMQEDEEENAPDSADIPADAQKAAQEAQEAHATSGLLPPGADSGRKRSLSSLAKSGIFREVSSTRSRVIFKNCWTDGLTMLLCIGRTRQSSGLQGCGGGATNNDSGFDIFFEMIILCYS